MSSVEGDLVTKERGVLGRRSVPAGVIGPLEVIYMLLFNRIGGRACIKQLGSVKSKRQQSHRKNRR